MSDSRRGRFAMTRSVIILLVFGIAATSLATGGKKPISKKQLPPAVLSAFTEQFPNAIIVAQSKEQREKKWYYEIRSKDSTISRGVLFDGGGTIIETEESMDPESLPHQVAEAVRVKYPKATMQHVASVKRGDHVEYEIRLLLGTKSTQVVVNSAGKLFKVK